jgi:hypothetical protein
MLYLPRYGLNRCVFYVATGIGLYSCQGIVINKVMETKNLVIGHKHGNEIYLLERFIAGDYEREQSYVCGYTRELDLTWVRKIIFLEMLHTKI